MARQVLAQPVCASSARERNWSLYGKTKTAESSRMGHETADKRIYCHEALHLREKLQSTGYKQETSRRPSTTPRPRPTWLCSGEMSPQGISLGHVFTVWTAVVNTDISQSVPAEIDALAFACFLPYASSITHVMKRGQTGHVLGLLALSRVCHASQLPPAVESVVDFCVSSRWGFSCFDASTSSRGVIAKAGMVGMGRLVGRGALATMGAVVARETWVTMIELRQSNGVALKRLNAPMPPPAAAAAASTAAEPMLAADVVADAVVAGPTGTEGAGPGPSTAAPVDGAAAACPPTSVPASGTPTAADSTKKVDVSLDSARVGAAPGWRELAREAGWEPAAREPASREPTPSRS